jgi:hypothetical protein
MVGRNVEYYIGRERGEEEGKISDLNEREREISRNGQNRRERRRRKRVSENNSKCGSLYDQMKPFRSTSF